MLKPSELLLVASTTLAATAVITVLVLLALRAAQRIGLAARLAIIVAGAIGSIVASSVAVGGEMYLSGHDLAVLGWVIGISAVVSMAAAWVIARNAITRSVASLVVAARRVGGGDLVAPVHTGTLELDAVSLELAESSHRLADARTRMAELDAARKQFFAWISHDLRTPLAGMRVMAEALEDGTAPDPEAYIRLIRNKVDTVNQMVGDLFELSKLQSGTFDLHPEPVVLLDLVSDAVSDVQAVASARGIWIDQDRIEGHVIWADPKELTRAIGNLLTNGVRHAPDNSVILVRADTTSTDELMLSVIDQGPGVTSENLGHMFDVGWREDTSRTNAEGSSGAGLGLAIVRGIVEAHGGHVQARHTRAGFQLDLILPVAP